ncbi:MAG: hypothetical protein LIP28_02250, partial [Deltaproteobacteria bacterium]|nr:hypothetical protein [Deltaproteobacteria bacterium]
DGETVPGAKERVHTGIAGVADGDGLSAAHGTLDSIRKEVKRVKEKLEEAKQRLAVATASGGDGGAAAPERTGEKDPAAKAAEAAEAATRSMGNAMGRAAEAESIQAEIDMLNQQLQTLNQQLQNALQGMGGGSAPVGTAGIGGVPDGPSGQGERISVN